MSPCRFAPIAGKLIPLGLSQATTPSRRCNTAQHIPCQRDPDISQVRGPHVVFATHLHPLYDLPEDSVPAIEVWRCAEGDEELRPVRVRPRVGHRKQPSPLVRAVIVAASTHVYPDKKRRSSAEVLYTPPHRRRGKVICRRVETHSARQEREYSPTTDEATSLRLPSSLHPSLESICLDLPIAPS